MTSNNVASSFKSILKVKKKIKNLTLLELASFLCMFSSWKLVIWLSDLPGARKEYFALVETPATFGWLMKIGICPLIRSRKHDFLNFLSRPRMCQACRVSCQRFCSCSIKRMGIIFLQLLFMAIGGCCVTRIRTKGRESALQFYTSWNKGSQEDKQAA